MREKVLGVTVFSFCLALAVDASAQPVAARIDAARTGPPITKLVVSEPLPFAFGSSQDWTGALLKTSADHIDFLGEHFCGYPNL
jgi:hypothetical protein